jgi:hypothetical protein
MKLSVHCAFEEGFVDLHFVFDALTTVTQQEFDKNENNRYPGIRRIYGVGSPETVKKYLAPLDSPSI